MMPRDGTRWHLLVIACFLAPLFLVRREMYDGIAILFAVQTGDFSGFKEWMFGQRWFLTYWFYLATGGFSRLTGMDHIILMRVILLGCFVAQYFQYRWIFTRVFGLREPAAVLALVATLFPSLQIYASSLGTVIPVFVLAGLTGYRLMLSGGGLRMAAGTALVLVSFQLNSMVTFLIGLQLCHLILGERQRRDWGVLALLAGTAAIFFVFRMVLSPPDGIYAGYNAMLVPTSIDAVKRIFRVVVMFATWGIIPLCALGVALGMQFAAGGKPQWVQGLRFARDWLVSARGRVMAAAWFVLLVFATGPYVVAGKGPPLLTVTAWGSGITEQAIRAAYASSWVAPTFSVTSGRHGVLLMVCVALLSWALVVWAARMVPVPAGHRGAGPWAVVAACAVPLFVLGWGGVWNRLQQQHAEISLVRGLQALPAPPAGLVDVAYQPASDWLIHLPGGNMVAAEAWGGWRYFGLLHGLPRYRDELLWIYHAGFVELGGATSPALQKIQPIAAVPATPCISSYAANLPSAGVVQVLKAGLFPMSVTAAQVTFKNTACSVDNIPPNPLPGRAVTY